MTVVRSTEAVASSPVVDSSPTTAVLESHLCELFGEALGVDVGADDDFFLFGGHSLLATQVIARVADELEVELDVSLLFEHPTPRALAEAVRDAKPSQPAGRAEVAGVETREDDSVAAPLSYSQARLWMLQNVVGSIPFYNVPCCFRLQGRLDHGTLEAAVSEIVRRHAALRTTFALVGTEPCQIVHPAAPVVVPVVDFSTTSDREMHARAWLAEEARAEFDLQSGPLMRVHLLRLADDDHILSFAMHHIVCDGTSIGILLKELAVLYEAYSEGRSSPLPPLSVQYHEYAVAQRERFNEGRYDAQLDYWRQQLDGAETLDLFTDVPRDVAREFRGGQLHFELERETADRLRAIAAREGATLYMVLLAGFVALLSRLTAQTDISVGTPIANRRAADLNELIGFFVNTLVLRVDAGGNPTMRELVRRVKDIAVGAYGQQEVPFEHVVEQIHPRRATGRNSFFQVHFQLLHLELHDVHFSRDLRAHFLENTNNLNPIDLLVHWFDTSEGLEAWLEHSLDLFDSSTAARIRDDYLTLLREWSAAPDARLRDVPLAEESAAVAVAGKRTTNVAGRRLDEGVARHAANDAAAVALIAGEDTRSYGELESAVRELAAELRVSGVTAGDRVAVVMPPSIDAVVATLGILRAGAAVVPIEHDAPAEWIDAAQHATGANVVMTASTSWSHIAPNRFGPRSTHDDCALVVPVLDDSGEIRPIELAHGTVLARLHGRSDVAPLEASDRVLLDGAAGTPSWIWQLFGPLEAGACAVVASAAAARDAGAWSADVARFGATVAHLAPSRFAVAVDRADFDALQGLRVLWCDGDPVPRVVLDDIDARLPARLFVGWGAVELGGLVLAWEHDRTDPRVVPAGRPVAGVDAAVFDDDGRMVGTHGAGELRFRCHEAGGDDWWRSGLPARVRADGAIEVHDSDTMRTTFGARPLSLTGISAMLRSHPAVADAAAVCHSRATGERLLVAYVVGRGDDDREEVTASIARVAESQAAFDVAYGRAPDDPTAACAGWNLVRDAAEMTPPAHARLTAARAEMARTRGYRRVLDVGAGTGSLVHALADDCDRYVAADVSLRAVERIEADVRRHQHGHVEVLHREADDFDGWEEPTFDLVVVDGVVEWMPSRAYLERVVAGAVAATCDGGTVMVGAVPDLSARRRCLERRMRRRFPHAAPSSDERRLDWAIAEDRCLAVDRRFFSEVVATMPGVRSVEIADIECGHDELDADAYDVLIAVEHLAADAPAAIPVDRAARGLTTNPLGHSASRAAAQLALSLREALRQRLPEALVPREVFVVDRLARSYGGQVVPALLPLPEGVRPDITSSFVAPRTPAERTVATIWCEVLGLERVGVEDNFFALGGDSLLALQISARLRDAFAGAVDPGIVFGARTIAGTVAMLAEAGIVDESGDAR